MTRLEKDSRRRRKAPEAPHESLPMTRTDARERSAYRHSGAIDHARVVGAQGAGTSLSQEKAAALTRAPPQVAGSVAVILEVLSYPLKSPFHGWGITTTDLAGAPKQELKIRRR